MVLNLGPPAVIITNHWLPRDLPYINAADINRLNVRQTMCATMVQRYLRKDKPPWKWTRDVTSTLPSKTENDGRSDHVIECDVATMSARPNHPYGSAHIAYATRCTLKWEAPQQSTSISRWWEIFSCCPEFSLCRREQHRYHHHQLLAWSRASSRWTVAGKFIDDCRVCLTIDSIQIARVILL